MYWHKRFLAEVYSSSNVLRHSAKEMWRGNRSRFYHRPTEAAVKDRIAMLRSGEWSRPPHFPVPDHSDYDPAEWGRAHITKNDCLAVLREVYDLRLSRKTGAGSPGEHSRPSQPKRIRGYRVAGGSSPPPVVPPLGPRDH
jgi:hypothetical protein